MPSWGVTVIDGVVCPEFQENTCPVGAMAFMVTLSPEQIVSGETRDTSGFGFTMMVSDVSAEHPFVAVTVTV